MAKARRALAQVVSNNRPIGENTSVRVSLMLGIVGLVVACVWWASSINAKLDVLVSRMGSYETEKAMIRSEVDSLKLWRAEVDRSGTKALDTLRTEVNALKMEVEIHAAREANGKVPH